jgi:HK97 family phage prohead protease
MTPLPRASLRTADDGNTLVGYPIVFNEWTEISGWEGNFLERVAPGALDKTLRERGDRVKVLFNHGFDPQIGDKPLGKPAVMDTRDEGLWTETPFSDTSWNADLKALIADGAIDGMSFRFSVTREDLHEPDETSDHNPGMLEERTIRELKLFEFGPVTFPAYEATTAGVRTRDAYRRYTTEVDAAPRGTSTDDTPPTRHLSHSDIERLLREIRMKGLRHAS